MREKCKQWFWLIAHLIGITSMTFVRKEREIFLPLYIACVS